MARASSRPRRQVVVTLSAEEWRALSAQATADDRDPFQQARWLLVRALGVRADAADERSQAPATADVA